MDPLRLYYATNRKHEGADQWNPSGYGIEFSKDGQENLRFGKVALKGVDNRRVNKCLKEKRGNGEGLLDYFTSLSEADQAEIRAYPEGIPDKTAAEAHQKDVKLGSKAMFCELHDLMKKSEIGDVLIYIHGFNVSWHDAVGSAFALQGMLNRRPRPGNQPDVAVVLFSWPSDGLATPFIAYRSDRAESRASGGAIGRGILKLHNFLSSPMNPDDPKSLPACGKKMHLLCHSMGNYVLQNSLERIDLYTPGTALPRIFEHIFLCAPDVDDDVLESGQEMGALHELGRTVSIYHNKQDMALLGSDYTKNNPERLGVAGAARPALLPAKIHQIDCTPIVHGFMEHSYYLWGPVNRDIRLSIDEDRPDGRGWREPIGVSTNLWRMKVGA